MLDSIEYKLYKLTHQYLQNCCKTKSHSLLKSKISIQIFFSFFLTITTLHKTVWIIFFYILYINVKTNNTAHFANCPSGNAINILYIYFFFFKRIEINEVFRTNSGLLFTHVAVLVLSSFLRIISKNF